MTIDFVQRLTRVIADALETREGPAFQASDNINLIPNLLHLTHNQRLSEDVAADAELVRAYEEQVREHVLAELGPCSHPRAYCCGHSVLMTLFYLQLRSDLQRLKGASGASGQ